MNSLLLLFFFFILSKSINKIKRWEFWIPFSDFFFFLLFLIVLLHQSFSAFVICVVLPISAELCLNKNRRSELSIKTDVLLLIVSIVMAVVGTVYSFLPHDWSGLTDWYRSSRYQDINLSWSSLTLHDACVLSLRSSKPLLRITSTSLGRGSDKGMGMEVRSMIHSEL